MQEGERHQCAVLLLYVTAKNMHGTRRQQEQDSSQWQPAELPPRGKQHQQAGVGSGPLQANPGCTSTVNHLGQMTNPSQQVPVLAWFPAVWPW